MATVTTTRIIMEVGVGTIAGDTGTAGTTGTITIAAGDMADTTGISGNSEERGFGPFLFRRRASIDARTADKGGEPGGEMIEQHPDPGG